ncbi:MAG: vitamin K epoxide reductase family protein [Actinobacteria bacterium]|nr:vitamin K epoxide reductase family protein [Actinomycetota bacterium]
MLVSSLASLTASLVLSIDAITLAKNPNSNLACNINAIISCGKVAVSWQSNLLGFPNAFIGLMSEPVVITVAVAGLVGVQFPRTFMRIATSVYFLGLLFAFWLFSQSYFVIGAFCPWCLLVTISTVTVFSSMFRVNALEGHLPFSEKANQTITRLMLAGWDKVVVVAIYSMIVLAVIFKYSRVIF